MKVTLHVGMGKTGTTSIQAFLNKNRQQLLDNKIFYTKNLDNIGIDGFKTANIDTIIHLDDVIKHLNQFLKKERIEHFIWSLESLFLSNKVTLKLLKEHLACTSIEIIIFIRRQDHWFESAFYQWGWKHKTYTGNYLINFDAFFKTRNHQGNYIEWILGWAEIFGKENIKIQPLEKEQMPDGLIKSFCNLTNLNQSELDTEELEVYKNPGHYVAQIIGICNSIEKEPIKNQPLLTMFQRAFNGSVINNRYKTNSLLSPVKRIEIINNFDNCNKTIATDFLRRSSGIIFYEPMPLETDEWLPFEELDLYKTIPILVELLLNQEKQMTEIKRRLVKLEQRNPL